MTTQEKDRMKQTTSTVVGWEAQNLHGLGLVSWVGCVHCTDPAQHLVTAGQDVDDLDHDLSDLSLRGAQHIRVGT